jgi:surface protein
MFNNCSGLTSLNLSNFDTSKVTTMSEMFYSCRGLTSLDLSKFDTTNVTSMSSMFHSCSGLTTIYVSDGWSTDKVTSSSNMFYGCSKLVGGNGTAYNSSYQDKTYARIDTAETPGYLTAKQ